MLTQGDHKLKLTWIIHKIFSLILGYLTNEDNEIHMFSIEDFCLCPVDIFLYHLQFTIMIRIFLLTLMIEFKVPPSSSRASIIPFVWMQFRLNLLSSINKGDDKLYSLRWIYIFIQIRQQHWDQKIWVWLCVLSALHLYEARYPSHISHQEQHFTRWIITSTN